MRRFAVFLLRWQATNVGEDLCHCASASSSVKQVVPKTAGSVCGAMAGNCGAGRPRVQHRLRRQQDRLHQSQVSEKLPYDALGISRRSQAMKRAHVARRYASVKKRLGPRGTRKITTRATSNGSAGPVRWLYAVRVKIMRNANRANPTKAVTRPRSIHGRTRRIVTPSTAFAIRAFRSCAGWPHGEGGGSFRALQTVAKPERGTK